jgi:hypothetical protein
MSWTRIMKPLRMAWSPEQIDHLVSLVKSGASPARAAAALGRRIIQVQNMARRVGVPFEDVRKVKRERLSREAEQLNAIESRSEQMGHIKRPMKANPALRTGS